MNSSDLEGLIDTLLERRIAYHPIFARITGSACAALFLSQLYYWSSRASHPEGWVYKAAVEWSGETGLSADELRGARRLLRNLKLIEESGAYKHFNGIHAFDRTACYRVNKKALYERICHQNQPPRPVVSHLGIPDTRESEIPRPSVENAQIDLGVPNALCTEITSETTTTTKWAEDELWEMLREEAVRKRKPDPLGWADAAVARARKEGQLTKGEEEKLRRWHEQQAQARNEVQAGPVLLAPRKTKTSSGHLQNMNKMLKGSNAVT